MRDFTTEQSKKYFGANLKRAKANYDKDFKRAKTEFEKKYPYADTTNFKFQIILSRDGEVSSPTKVYYFDENGTENRFRGLQRLFYESALLGSDKILGSEFGNNRTFF